MPQTFAQDVVIDGSADAKQLRVQGHTTQTNPLETWEDSAGNTLAQVTGDGRLQVGDDVGLSSPDALIEAHRHEDSTTKPKRGFHALGRISGTLNSVVQWMVAELELRGSGVISAVHSALRVKATNLNTGTPATGAELRVWRSKSSTMPLQVRVPCQKPLAYRWASPPPLASKSLMGQGYE
ncbi:MAG: hypothetical protein R3E39_26360 [Anaerolineae bacterium]